MLISCEILVWSCDGRLVKLWGHLEWLLRASEAFLMKRKSHLSALPRIECIYF